MDREFEKILHDPDLSDDVKIALAPELLKAEAAKTLANTSKKSPRQKLLQSGPVIAAMASVLTLAISEGVKVYISKEQSKDTRSLEQLKQEHIQWMETAKRDFDTRVATLDREHERSLERLKFQFEVIRSAIVDTKLPQERADTLLFFTDIKLLDGLDGNALIRWGSSKNVPSIAAARPAAQTGNQRITGTLYKQLGGADVYGPDTSSLDPSNKQLLAALGCPVSKNGPNPALTKIDLPFPMQVAWDVSTTINRISVHEAVAPFLMRALKKIDADGLQDHARFFGGLYNRRKSRFTNNWSNHTWGAEIDIDPAGNRFRWDETKFTMHPAVVRAFKEAGFAWRGDRGFDAMSFVISAKSLEKIKSSGYQPKITENDCNLNE